MSPTKEVPMRIDRYTKVVLTVIALCLIWLSVGGPSLLPSVAAQGKQSQYGSGYGRVVIAGWVDEKNAEHPLPSAKTDATGNTSVPGVPVAVVFGSR
jgi:hypothetical protein